MKALSGSFARIAVLNSAGNQGEETGLDATVNIIKFIGHVNLATRQAQEWSHVIGQFAVPVAENSGSPTSLLMSNLEECCKGHHRGSHYGRKYFPQFPGKVLHQRCGERLAASHRSQRPSLRRNVSHLNFPDADLGKLAEMRAGSQVTCCCDQAHRQLPAPAIFWR